MTKCECCELKKKNLELRKQNKDLEIETFLLCLVAKTFSYIENTEQCLRQCYTELFEIEKEIAELEGENGK